jgi:signal recognition particle receptor subunit beta
LAILNARERTLGLKIVYVGPGFSGKTTNLHVLHRELPPERRSRLTSLAGEGERTLFFDFMALDLGQVAGLSTRFHLFTVPGQAELVASRRSVLHGADGLIAVIDSGAERFDANRAALADVEAALAAMGPVARGIPRVYQYNKRDLPDAIPLGLLDRELNPGRWPAFPAKAREGVGVTDCLRAIFKLTLVRIGAERPATSAEHEGETRTGLGRPRRPRWISSHA